MATIEEVQAQFNAHEQKIAELQKKVGAWPNLATAKSNSTTLKTLIDEANTKVKSLEKDYEQAKKSLDEIRKAHDSAINADKDVLNTQKKLKGIEEQALKIFMPPILRQSSYGSFVIDNAVKNFC